MEEAEAARKAALQIWHQLEHPARVGHTLCALSQLAWILGQRSTAEAYASEAVQVLEPLPAGAGLAMAYSNKAQLAMLADNHAEAICWGEQAIVLARQVGDVDILVHALNNVGTAQLASQNEQGWGLLEQSLQLALEHGFERHAARAYSNLTSSALRSRDYPHAQGYLDAGIAYCAEHDLDSLGSYLHACQALVWLQQSAWQEAAEEATRLLRQYRLSPIWKILPLLVLGWVRLRRGDPGSEALLEEAYQLALSTGELQRIVPVASARAAADAPAGEFWHSSRQAPFNPCQSGWADQARGGSVAAAG